MPTDKLHVGLLLNGDTLPAWEKRSVDRMVERDDVALTHLVFDDRSTDRDLSYYVNQIKEYPLWAPLGALRMVFHDPEYKHHQSVFDIDGAADATQIRCTPEPAPDFGNVLPDAVVAEMGAETDLLVRFGFGILKGNVLDAPKHGVLSYHHGDLRRYRGQPAGFWEFINGEREAGVTLQRINETLDGGEIVVYEPVDITRVHTWQDVQRKLFAASEGMLAAAVERIQDPDFSPLKPDALGELHSLPQGTAVVRYAVKNNVGRVRNAVGL